MLRVEMVSPRVVAVAVCAAVVATLVPAGRSGSEPIGKHVWTHPVETSAIINFVRKLNAPVFGELSIRLVDF